MHIYTHKHHIIPKHMGGTDHPENIIELTIEDHAIAHRHLWKMYGRWQDKIAWLGLSGHIDKGEIIRSKASEANRGRIRLDLSEFNKTKKGKTLSDEHREKISKATKGENNPRYGKLVSDETRQKISNSNKNQVAWNKTPIMYKRVRYDSLEDCKKLTGLTRWYIIHDPSYIKL
jgi:hypothetical protein